MESRGGSADSKLTSSQKASPPGQCRLLPPRRVGNATSGFLQENAKVRIPKQQGKHDFQVEENAARFVLYCPSEETKGKSALGKGREPR